MRRRPLFWGIIVFIVAGFGWFLSVIGSVVTLGAFKDAANFFGITAAASLPIAGIFEIIRWTKRGKSE